ncbi:RNA polymerase factor sigma-32 [bacterium]|nr:RNA polymerase factor sigma-32 [bacterium]
MSVKKPKKSAEKAPKKAAPNRKMVTKASKPAGSGSTSLTQTDPLLSAYLKEIQRYPLLSREEEHELAVKFSESKDRESLQRLVTSNLRFVVKIAFEYVHYRAKLLDLIQEGNMGLVRAVQDFNPYKDVRLTTYAVWWIRSYIQDYLLRNHSLVKIGTTQAQKRLFYRLRAEQKKLEQMGVSPGEGVKLLASKLDVREQDVREMDQRLSHSEVSLNAPEHREEKREAIQNLADPGEAPDTALGDQEQRKIFHEVLQKFATTLEGREKLIFQERLISESPLTLQEIGDKYSITKERARQIEEHVKNKLREFVRENYPDFKLLSMP